MPHRPDPTERETQTRDMIRETTREVGEACASLADKACAQDPSEAVPHMKEDSLESFRTSGMLWLINHILQPFGWSLVLEYAGDTAVRLWPSRSER